MKNIIHHIVQMAEAGEPAGGGAPAQTQPENLMQETTPTEQQKPAEQPKPPEQAEQAKPVEQTEEAKPTEQKPAETEKPPVNLMDDDPETVEKPKEGEEAAGPTEEERTAFVEAVKKIDIGEGVSWDDPALEAMAPAIMELAGGDAKKTERLVKDYTKFRQAEIRIANERHDQFLNGLVDECRRELGADLKATVELAKKGGLHVFGEELWPVMRGVREFGNNVKIIKRLAAIGRTVTDDPGVIKKETAAKPVKRDWRESMYGGHN